MELVPETGVLVPRSAIVSMELAARKSWAGGFRLLVKALFSEDILATHSAMGRRSQWPALDAHTLGVAKGLKYNICYDLILHADFLVSFHL